MVILQINKTAIPIPMHFQYLQTVFLKFAQFKDMYFNWNNNSVYDRKSFPKVVLRGSIVQVCHQKQNVSIMFCKVVLIMANVYSRMAFILEHLLIRVCEHTCSTPGTPTQKKDHADRQ